jgi:glycosyltransferase involved in cell wall biosynthesis
MRILSIHTNGTISGGGDVVFIQGNRLLATRGHEVAWLTIGDAPYATEYGQVAYCLPEFRKGSKLQKQINLAAGHIYSQPARRLAERARREFLPEIVHIHNIQGHLSPSVLLPFKNHSIPIVQTLHDYRLLCPAIHFLSHGRVCESCKGKRYYYCTLKRCRKGELLRSSVAALGSYVRDYFYQYDKLISAYIAPSEFMRKKMVEYGYAQEKIHLLPNAYFGHVPEPEGSKREHILFAGRLSPEKGVDLLIRAVKNLKVVVNIAGDGPERERLHGLAKEINARNVNFLGFLNAGELGRLYQSALVTVLPSRWYENGPLVVLESYANSTPVVGARIGAIPEFIEDGKTGLLFTPNDADNLHIVLQYCLTHPGSLKRMGETALRRVKAENSQAAYLKGLEKILNDVVKVGSREN